MLTLQKNTQQDNSGVIDKLQASPEGNMSDQLMLGKQSRPDDILSGDQIDRLEHFK